MHRREFLGSSATAGASLLAGCGGLEGSVLGSDGLSANFSNIYVQSHDIDPHTVHVTIERDEDLVYWRSKRVEGKEKPGPDLETLGEASFEDLPTKKATYTVHGKLDDRDTWETVHFAAVDDAAVDDEAETVGVTFVIGRPDHQSPTPIFGVGLHRAYGEDGNSR